MTVFHKVQELIYNEYKEKKTFSHNFLSKYLYFMNRFNIDMISMHKDKISEYLEFLNTEIKNGAYTGARDPLLSVYEDENLETKTGNKSETKFKFKQP